MIAIVNYSALGGRSDAHSRSIDSGFVQVRTGLLHEVWLGIANHRNIVFHPYVVVWLYNLVAHLEATFVELVFVSCQDMFYWLLLSCILVFRKVEVQRCHQVVHGAVSVVVVVYVKSCCCSTFVSTHQRLVRNQRMVLTEFGPELLRVFGFTVLKLQIIIVCRLLSSSAGIGALPHRFAIEGRLWFV